MPASSSSTITGSSNEGTGNELHLPRPVMGWFASPIGRRYVLVMDFTTKLNVARTEELIARVT